MGSGRTAMNERLERVVTGAFVLIALTLTGVAVHREFSPPDTVRPSAPRAVGRLTFQAEWTEASRVGRVLGNPNAAIQIIILSDLECPACSRFDKIATKVRGSSEEDVSIVFVHFPLDMHRFAMPAARAAECAATMGKFEPFLKHVYAKQDSLGLKPWGMIAMEAGIADTARIAACARSTSAASRIAAGIKYGRKIGVNATPTVMVNGWRFWSSPTEPELVDAIEALRGGGTPPGAEIRAERAP